MKRLFYIGIAAMLALSCSADDDGGKKSTVPLEGTWKLTTFDLTVVMDANNDGTASKSLLDETSCFNNNTLLFAANGTGIINKITAGFDTELAEGSETDYNYIVACDEGTQNFTYTFSDNSVNFDGDAVFIRSGNKLIFDIPEFLNVPIEEDGEIEYVPTGAHLEFTKQ